MNPESCYGQGFCERTERTRSEVSGVSDTMLDHVTKLWAVRDGYGNCGGSGNRIFFSADDILMARIRNRMTTVFGPSNDPMPPHAVEIDIDYNFFQHDSNPQCSYDGTLGRYRYEQSWRGQGRGRARNPSRMPSCAS